MSRALTILNEQGDQTIVWTPDRDAEMERIIEKKMAEGIVFFVIEPRFGGLTAPALTPLKKVEDARKHRALAIKDEDFTAFCGMAGADVVKTPEAKAKTVRKARTPKEVAQNESVGVQPMRGG